MQITPEQLGLAVAQREMVTAAVLKAVADAPKGFNNPAHVALATGSTMDGVLAALAWIAEGSELYTSPRDRRRFADQCREGLIKFMKVAQADLEAGLDWENPHGAAN